MSETQNLLDSLRDVIEPPPPAATSLWLIAANLGLILIIIAVSLSYAKRRRNQWRTLSLKTISYARKESPDKALLMLAKLLRQVMMHRQHDINNVSGEAWLNLLDREFSTHWFSNEQGQVFGNALYQPVRHTTQHRDHWCNAIESMIRQLPSTLDKKQSRGMISNRTGT